MDDKIFEKVIENNLSDHLIVSDFDQSSFNDVELCLGIDEAGRGPVLGRKATFLLLLLELNHSNIFLSYVKDQWFMLAYFVQLTKNSN